MLAWIIFRTTTWCLIYDTPNSTIVSGIDSQNSNIHPKLNGYWPCLLPKEKETKSKKNDKLVKSQMPWGQKIKGQQKYLKVVNRIRRRLPGCPTARWDIHYRIQSGLYRVSAPFWGWKDFKVYLCDIVAWLWHIKSLATNFHFHPETGMFSFSIQAI